MLRIENINVHYDNLHALQNVSLEIEDANIIGIIGPNGAGKSTLIKAMLNIIDHKGKTYIDNTLLKENLSRVAYVEQKINIDYNFPIRVRECVSLGLYSKIKLFRRVSSENWKKVDKALETVGLKELANRQISQLSGGQFQRVLIARCLVQDADYIFLDEPFVGIDSTSEDIIMDTLRELRNKGKTICIVHHDLKKAKYYFDKVLLLNQKIIAYGDTEKVFCEKNLNKAFQMTLFMGGEY